MNRREQQDDCKALLGVCILGVIACFVMMAAEAGWKVALLTTGIMTISVVLGMVALANSGWIKEGR